MLEASSTAVFTNRIGGLGMLAQSSESPRRTTKALVNAANTMVLAASSTNSPVKDARRDGAAAVRAAAAAAPSAIDRRRRRTFDDVVCEGPSHTHMDALCLGMDFRRIGLHDEIAAARPAHCIHTDRDCTTGCTPAKLSNGGGEGMVHSRVVEFQGFIGRLRALLHAPEEVDRGR